MSTVNVEMVRVRAVADAEFFGNNGAAKVSVAVDNGKDKNGTKRPADFYEVLMFGKVAERYASKIKKGQLMNLKGSLTTGEYTKNDVKVKTTSVVMSYCEPASYWPSDSADTAEDEVSEDCPFC